MTDLVYPAKCILCQKLLTGQETDLCSHCRKAAPVLKKGNFKISFVARWTAVWYYKDDVRKSLQRYKFSRKTVYAAVYGRLLAAKLQQAGFDDFDLLTWVPTSFLRRWTRGFDHAARIARVTARELGCQAVPTLRKVRHNPPQSSLKDAAARRANVLGAYRVKDRSLVAGKRILLLDDIITSGATVSECAKTLTVAGAQSVLCAAVAAASHDKKSNKTQ